VRIWAKMPPLRRRLRPKIPKHIQHELEWLLRETTLQGVQTVAAKLSLAVNVTALQRLYESPAEPRLVLLLARQLYDQMRPHYQMSWGRALMRAAWLNAQAFVRKQLPHWIPAKRGKTLSQQGAIIAVIGADGSGKSTLSRDLARWLRYKLDVHQFYMGSGDGAGGPIHMIRRRVAGLIRSRKKQNRVPKTGSHAYSVLGRSYRLIDLVLMRRKLRMLRLGRQLASRGSVILLDRYPQNQVNGLSDGPRLQEGRGFAWAARMEEKLYREAATIGPDMLIRLRVHPQTAQARKPDHHPDIIARKCEIIEKLEFPRSKVVNIDANQTYTEVLEHAKRSVWQFLTRQTKGSHGH